MCLHAVFLISPFRVYMNVLDSPSNTFKVDSFWIFGNLYHLLSRWQHSSALLLLLQHWMLFLHKYNLLSPLLIFLLVWLVCICSRTLILWSNPLMWVHSCSIVPVVVSVPLVCRFHALKDVLLTWTECESKKCCLHLHPFNIEVCLSWAAFSWAENELHPSSFHLQWCMFIKTGLRKTIF